MNEPYTYKELAKAFVAAVGMLWVAEDDINENPQAYQLLKMAEDVQKWVGHPKGMPVIVHEKLGKVVVNTAAIDKILVL
jgi:hypothetical protein